MAQINYLIQNRSSYDQDGRRSNLTGHGQRMPCNRTKRWISL